MTNHSKHFGRQLLVMAAVLLGVTLLLMGLVPPQEAQSKEKKSETAQSQQEEGEKATPADNDQEEGEKADTPAEGDKEAQEKKRVLDKDPEGNEVVAGELLVSYKQGAAKKAKDEVPKKVGGKVEKDFPEIEVKHVSVPEVKNEQSQETRQDALKEKKEDLEQDPAVEAVDYNYVREGSWVPNDTRYSSQWALPKINAPQGWDTTRGSSSVKVAILDSGINRNHQDLLGKVVGQKDFVNDDNDASDDVAYGGHGTLVAGIAAANTNNSEGVAGTCPNCSLLIAKVLNSSNKALKPNGTDVDIVAAINWAIEQKANVINMSFGLAGYSSALETAINNAWGKGAVLVAAAGNEGRNDLTVYPAAYPNVIAVAATDSNDKRAIYEDQPGGSYPYKYYDSTAGAWKVKNVKASNAGPWVDVAAPGKGILTTTSPLGGYENAWGTSMAAPHVSGLAGLLFSKGSMSNAQVRNKIESTATELGTAGKDPVFGSGRIDALAALSYQETDPAITYSGTWKSGYLSGATGNYVKYATSFSASAKFSFTGKGVTWWGSKGPGYGVAYVYVDGSYAYWIDLYSSSSRPRQALFSKSWSTSGKHTIEIEVEGTYGRPRVDVDAFSVTQP